MGRGAKHRGILYNIRTRLHEERLFLSTVDDFFLNFNALKTLGRIFAFQGRIYF